MIQKNPVTVLVYILVAVILLAMGLILVCARPANAGEWVNIEQFKGLSTHTNGLGNDMSVARYVDGWFVRNEGLTKPWFTKIRSSAMVNSPVYILGQNTSNDAVLLYSDNLFSMIDQTIDPIGYAQTVRTDSGYTSSATDSILYNWENSKEDADSTRFVTVGHKWLMWTLTDRSSVVWDSLTYPVSGFYSNRWLLGRNSTQTVQTAPMGFPVSVPDVDEGTGTLELPVDTTLIFDGSYIWVYSADTDSILNSSTTTVTAPTYPDTGRVENIYESGDSLVIVIDPTADAFYDSTFEAFWILWDDSLLSSHATPCSVLSSIEYTTDSVRLVVLSDTTKYKGVDHYWGRQNGSGARHMFYLLYRPGAMTQYKRLGGIGTPAKSRDSLVNLDPPLAGVRYAVFTTHAQDGIGIEDLDVGFNSRTTDRNIWQITTATNVGGASDLDTAYCMLLQYSASSSFGANYRWFKFLIWDTDTIKASDWGHGGNYIQSLYRRPQIGAYNATTNPTGWAITTVSTATSLNKFATLGRQRSWASGNTHINSTTGVRDSSTYLYYSRLIGKTPGDTVARSGNAVINYMVFPAENKFQVEGRDPFTGLSMLGQTLAAYRRRSITLLTGFAPGDFYTQPAPVGQGAVNHWVISRSVEDNADAICNENGMFLFDGGGLTPLSEPIVEVFSDSINWDAENKLRGAVYDGMYFVTAPTDTATTNQRIIAVDMETRNPWIMSRPRASSVWNFRDDDGSEEMYFGDADSSVVWYLGGAANNLYFIPEWKSSWSDLGDPEQVKTISQHRIEVDPGSYTDTVFVDWSADLTDTVNYNDTVQVTPLWTDTIPCNTNEAEFLSRYPSHVTYPGGLVAWTAARNLARGKDTKRQTIYRVVPRKVAGKFLSFGIRGKSNAAAPLVVMRYGFEYDMIGKRRR